VALSPRANYIDWAAATCGRNLVPTFVDRGVSRGQRGGSLTVVNLSFLDLIHYFFFQVAPHLSSQGLSAPGSKPTATKRKSGSAGNRTRDLWLCSQEVWPIDHRGSQYLHKDKLIAIRWISFLLLRNAAYKVTSSVSWRLPTPPSPITVL
jgi:hypothetical protein